MLAGGAIAAADTLLVELHQPVDSPGSVFVRWPEAPSVCDPHPRMLANIAASVVRVLAKAQAQLAKIRAH
jgi:hypothetical protein